MNWGRGGGNLRRKNKLRKQYKKSERDKE